ncbi:hypothetical protein FTUN_3942 [Frigoriglobus tundricola]|uniref:Uncharacterized protein n=1 Tax=Frigoriglobus tundricola TaxID=2774151 RepID=A0A6M5YQT2_9BACT|nr:hypothetical protein FTUN_3942 [Frigoriglobus tundricola]
MARSHNAKRPSRHIRTAEQNCCGAGASPAQAMQARRLHHKFCPLVLRSRPVAAKPLLHGRSMFRIATGRTFSRARECVDYVRTRRVRHDR